MDQLVGRLAKKYRKMMKAGMAPQGRMTPVKDVTMNSPIRWGGPDKRIRREVNSNQRTPIQATGATINSVREKRLGDTWEISPNTSKGNMILSRNVDLGRDPLQLSNTELRLIEDQLLDDFIRSSFG